MFRKTKFACFHSYVEDISNATSIIIYTYKYMQNISKVILLKREGSGRRKRIKE
jgi:hypothetical protein